MNGGTSLLSTFLGVRPQTSEESVLRLLIELGAKTVAADEGSLLVVDEESDSLVFAMTVGSDESEMTLVGQSVPMGKGITGLAAQTLEVQVGAPSFKDVKQSERRGGEEGVPEAVMAAPMLVGEKLVGVLTAVSFAQGKRFNSADAQTFAGFAAIAGLVVEQRHRLNAYEAEGGEPPKALERTAELQREIMASVARIVQKAPMDDQAALKNVLAVLGGLETLMAAGEDE